MVMPSMIQSPPSRCSPGPLSISTHYLFFFFFGVSQSHRFFKKKKKKNSKIHLYTRANPHSSLGAKLSQPQFSSRQYILGMRNESPTNISSSLLFTDTSLILSNWSASNSEAGDLFRTLFNEKLSIITQALNRAEPIQWSFSPHSRIHFLNNLRRISALI